jgi:hypothetical protein
MESIMHSFWDFRPTSLFRRAFKPFLGILLSQIVNTKGKPPHHRFVAHGTRRFGGFVAYSGCEVQ